jgi:hypothetical protein
MLEHVVPHGRATMRSGGTMSVPAHRRRVIIRVARIGFVADSAKSVDLARPAR